MQNSHRSSKVSSHRCVPFSFTRVLLLSVLVTVLLLVTPHVYAAQVTLAWEPNLELDLAGYRIYYGTSTGNYDYYIDVGKETRCTISNLQEGKTYFFAATAYDLDGNESGFSDEVSCTILQNAPHPQSESDPQSDSNLQNESNLQSDSNLQNAPGLQNPSGLRNESGLGNESELTLAWNPNTEPHLAGYRIYCGTSSREYQYYVDVGNQTSCIFAEFTEGSTYFFAVTAYDFDGNESGFSDEVILIVR